MPESTLVCWLGEHGIQLFRIPANLSEYAAADGCYLNYSNLDPTELPEGAADATEHLAYCLGVEPYYAHEKIPFLREFLQIRKSQRENREGMDSKDYNFEEEPTLVAAVAPFSGFEIGDTVKFGAAGGVQAPIIVQRIIRCGWLA